ncbi:MAG: class I SAM-dependent RNA methyltransferase [Ruminococcaceae bacterium]|jgi:putative N6-adenine-specific DNA methylase|nr:class I SAM-dependent RNA methyltransferase [Oscillospiraceae bacterium]
MKINFVIPCLLGVEGIIADELRSLEAEDVKAENGRVLFSGDENLLARVNICSHFAERVQILVGSFKATTFEELFQGTKNLPWEQWILKDDAFPVKGYSLKSTLFSVSDCQAIIKKAVVERLKSKYGISWFDETGPTHQIQFSIMNDEATLLIDTSGAGLHKRGYRLQSNFAPMKETLAAAICSLAKLKHYHTLYDPMCGSGTLMIEGALYAHNIAPGLNRHFSAERFEVLPKNIWAEERERARSLEKIDTDFQGFGSDIDGETIKLAMANAARLPIGKKLHFEKRDIKDFQRHTERGTVLVNPPYGERLLDLQEAERLYREMGRVFPQSHGWSYYIITPDEEFETCFGRKADKRRKLYNGMIKCQLYMYFK